MSRFPGARILPPSVLLGLAYGAVVVAVAGWIAAQSSDDRTTEAWQFTGAMVHGLAASTFAVVFALSATLNALLVTTRLRDGPRSYRLGGYPLWQGVVIVLGIGWATTVAVTIESNWGEIAFGLGIAVASIGACVQAVRQDPESADRRVVRREMREQGRTDAQRRIIRRLRVGIPVAVGVMAITGIVVAQSVVVVYRDCTVIGTGNFNGALSISTSDCGHFAVAPHLTMADLEGAYRDDVDFTTQGYAFGLPPEPVIIAIGG